MRISEYQKTHPSSLLFSHCSLLISISYINACNSLQQLEQCRQKLKKSSSEAENDSAECFKQILQELKQINGRLTNLEVTVNAIEQSMDSNANDILELQKDVQGLKSSIPATEEKVQQIELQNLHKSVEIQGIPHETSEVPIQIVLKMTKLKSLEITADHIDVAYRNKSKKSLVARFLQTHKRELFIATFKRSKDSNNIKATELGFKTTSFINVNEFLSYETRQLLYTVRQFKVKHNYQYAWTRNQRVYLRKTSDSTTISIKTPSDLQALIESD